MNIERWSFPSVHGWKKPQDCFNSSNLNLWMISFLSCRFSRHLFIRLFEFRGKVDWKWMDRQQITSNFGPHWSLMRTYRLFFLNEWRDEIKHLSDAENDSDFLFIWAHLAGHNRLLLPTIVFHSTRSHLTMLTAVSLMHVSVIVKIWWRRFGKPKTDMLLILSR